MAKDEGGLNMTSSRIRNELYFLKKVIVVQLYRAKQIQMEELVTMPFGKVLLSN